MSVKHFTALLWDSAKPHAHQVRTPLFPLFSLFFCNATTWCVNVVGVTNSCLTNQIVLKTWMGLSATTESIHTDLPIKMVGSYQTHFVSCGIQFSETAFQDTEWNLPQELIVLTVIVLSSAIIHPFYFRETCKDRCI